MTEEEQQAMLQQMVAQRQAQAAAATPVSNDADPAPTGAVEGFDETDQSTWGNPGRNDACPCGSGKKFKHCHGAL